LLFRVNGAVVTGEELVSDVVQKLGNELTIDPVLKYRAKNGLIFDNRDFMEQFALLKEYTTREDLSYYIKLYPVHYASETFKYNREYIGDAILLLAHKLIKDGNENREEILRAINCEFNGISNCEYENNLFEGDDHTQAINELKGMIKFKLRENICKTIIRKIKPKRENSYTLESIENLRVAIYTGDRDSSKLIEELKMELKESGAEYIPFEMSSRLAGQTLIETNPHMAYIKGATMLLDALDSGADVLVFKNGEDFELFKSTHQDLEKSIGREIDLKLLSLEKLHELMKLIKV
jgi:hypothetical protein